MKSTWRCFVIQPFDDGGPYDKRYDETFEPAIKEAGLEAYRIDKDPGVDVPIDEIERQIAGSIACLADISTDNPNVWFELGYALAKNRVVILVCSDEREGGYPFDVRHRKIIKYSTKSASGYAKLRQDITRNLQERRPKMEHVAQAPDVSAAPQPTDLKEHEVEALTIVAGEFDGTIRSSYLHEKLVKSGLKRYAASLASHSLLEKRLLEEADIGDWEEPIPCLRVTRAGMVVVSKLMEEGSLPVQAEDLGRSQRAPFATSRQPPITEPDDDLPF
ncbi:MAG: hypothetical protein OXI76_06535 [Gemmatimonadota bacterium]|nr:hypothetical protein [Gemmatimonadota bacterium]